MNKNLNKILKTSIVTLSVLTIINCIGIIGSSNALFEKSVDSKNSLSIKVASPLYAKPGIATDAITNLSKLDTTNLVYDETVDNNLRYIGANPNNYVLFNNELWRIIGVMNNIDDGTGKKETRIKLLRNESAYTGSAFDTNNVNDYSQSSLKTTLNETYYNELSLEAKSMIDNVVWNLGSTTIKGTATQFYNSERGKDVYSKHATIWIGKIGLIYPSDYRFATSGTTKFTRKACININANDNNWNISNEGQCAKNNYIVNGLWQWTLTPLNNNNDSKTITIIVYDGTITGVYSYDTNIYRTSRPTLYLKPEVRITSGYGTKDRPYQIDL